MTKRACLAAILLLGAARSAGAQPAAVAPQEEGRERFRRGIELFRDGDYRAALIEFNRANQAAPSFRIQYNIAQTCLELQDYACALHGYERYLALGGREVPRDRRLVAEGEIARLQKRVATVRIMSNKDGAEVFVDDVSVGRTPLAEPLLVGAGRHKIGLSLAPSPASVKVIDVAGGDRLDLRLELVEPQTPSPAASPPPQGTETPTGPARARAAPSRTPVWVGLATTGALAVGVGVTGALALAAKADLDSTLGKADVGAAEVDDARTRTRTLTTVTDVLLLSTVLCAGITAVLFFTTRTSTTHGTAPSMRVGLGAGAASIWGTF